MMDAGCAIGLESARCATRRGRDGRRSLVNAISPPTTLPFVRHGSIAEERSRTVRPHHLRRVVGICRARARRRSRLLPAYRRRAVFVDAARLRADAHQRASARALGGGIRGTASTATWTSTSYPPRGRFRRSANRCTARPRLRARRGNDAGRNDTRAHSMQLQQDRRHLRELDQAGVAARARTRRSKRCGLAARHRGQPRADARQIQHMERSLFWRAPDSERSVGSEGARFRAQPSRARLIMVECRTRKNLRCASVLNVEVCPNVSAFMRCG